MNESVVTFEYNAVIKTTLKQNKRLAAKSSKKDNCLKFLGYEFRMYEFA
jgi:hypothetical protein